MLTFLPIAILKDLNMQMRVKIILIVLMGMSILYDPITIRLALLSLLLDIYGDTYGLRKLG
jgi:hypothetical protein